MATRTAPQQWKYAQQIEGQLLSLLKKEGKDAPKHDDVDHLIEQLRLACEATIFLDVEFACKEGVGKRLWDAHISINNRYRKYVGQFKKGDQKKNVVERRKLEKHYVDFIKTSQFFYKGYIQRLASHFSGMKGLRRVAQSMSLSTLSADPRVKVSPEVEHLIEMSVHATLLRLGDLSRYRNDLRTKDRSWEPAMGHYLLANDLYPDSGQAHNQMAVIALAEGNHLNAVYHLYRALAVKEPHLLAKGNLELEFKKITSAWEKKRLQPKMDSLSTLIWWFVLLHSRFYDGVDFSTHDELENEVLSRLALLLKEQSFGDTLEKFVIINIAAESFAGQRVQEQDKNANQQNIKSFYFCLAFNVRMMFVLLQVLLPELEDSTTGEELPNGTSHSERAREKITATTRRVLPALRQYSVWLTSMARLIVATKGVSPINVHIKELWKMYADLLTRLAQFFPVEDLQTVGYLLEEDESTYGFKPFRDANLNLDANLQTECDLYTAGNGESKPRCTDPGLERLHPNIEMQSRIRDILKFGIALQLKDDIPITLTHDTGMPVFTFVEEGLSIVSPVRPRVSSPSFASPERTNGNYAMPPPNRTYEVTPAESAESVAASDSHQSMDTDMHRMVDSLLEPSPSSRNTASIETSYGMHSATANEVFAPVGSNGFDAPRLHSTPKMLPSLTGLYNSAFTPQPNELPSPNRPTTARQLSPLSLSTNEQRLAAAAALDEMTGYGSGKRSSWGRPSRPLSNPISQPVNQLLQESLSQQYMPVSSSAWSESSSIYANTPQQPRRPGSVLRASAPAFPHTNGNDSTHYPGGTDFDKNIMLQSSVWNGSQPASTWGGYVQTPPGGQGG